MTDRIELQRRARRGQQPVRSDEPPTSLSDYRARRDLAAYNERRGKIREARAAFERQQLARRSTDGAPRFLLTYLAVLVVVVVIAIARSCA